MRRRSSQTSSSCWAIPDCGGAWVTRAGGWSPAITTGTESALRSAQWSSAPPEGLADMGIRSITRSGFASPPKRELIRAAVVGMVIFASLVVGLALGLRRTGMLRPELIVAGVLAVSCLPLWLWLRRLEYGILAILLAAGLLNIFTLPTGTQSPLVLSLFVANQIEDVRWLKRITWIILGLGAFAVVSLLFKLPTAAAISNGSRGLFATWVGVLAYTQLLFNRDLNRLRRILLLALFLA